MILSISLCKQCKQLLGVFEIYQPANRLLKLPIKINSWYRVNSVSIEQGQKKGKKKLLAAQTPILHSSIGRGLYGRYHDRTEKLFRIEEALTFFSKVDFYSIGSSRGLIPQSYSSSGKAKCEPIPRSTTPSLIQVAGSQFQIVRSRAQQMLTPFLILV
jgi:hypothetical protein